MNFAKAKWALGIVAVTGLVVSACSAPPSDIESLIDTSAQAVQTTQCPDTGCFRAHFSARNVLSAQKYEEAEVEIIGSLETKPL